MATKPHPPSRHLASNIRAAREAANLTQLALAHKLGYAGPDAGAYISRLESGQEPRIDTLGRLAKALDTTIEALLSAPEKRKK